VACGRALVVIVDDLMLLGRPSFDLNVGDEDAELHACLGREEEDAVGQHERNQENKRNKELVMTSFRSHTP
jgi:hypothetical protein